LTGNLSCHLKNDHNLRDIDSPGTSLAVRGTLPNFFNNAIPIKSSRDRKWALGRDLANKPQWHQRLLNKI